MNYETLPNHMQNGIRNYVEAGVPVGSFLFAVITNKLVEAFGRADDINIDNMKIWAAFLYNEMPTESWGSEERYEKWVKHQGLKDTIL